MLGLMAESSSVSTLEMRSPVQINYLPDAVRIVRR